MILSAFFQKNVKAGDGWLAEWLKIILFQNLIKTN